MKHALATLGCLALASCSHPSKPPCTAESVAALRQLYEAAASQVISSGACDQYQRVEKCPQYLLVEKHFEVAATAMCGGVP